MKEKAFIGASLMAGIAASLCCILPIVFAMAGAGIVGASAFFAGWRPYLLGITFLLILMLLAESYEKGGDAARAKKYYSKVMANNGHGPTHAFERPVARKKLAGG